MLYMMVITALRRNREVQPGLSCPVCVCGSSSLVCNDGITASLALIWKRMGFALEWNEDNFCSF